MNETGRLSYEFTWAEPAADGSAGTRGLLEVRCGDEVLWPAGDFWWTWWELLEWLSQSWTALHLHDGLPVPVEAVDATRLQAAARLAVDRSPDRAEQLEEELWSFQEAHDLDRALHGASRGELLIWREGLLAVVVTEDGRLTTSWTDATAFLTELGDAIAERIREFGTDEPDRWLPLLHAWEGRDRPATEIDLAQVAGRDLDEWSEITNALRRGAVGWSGTPVNALDIAHDELLVAARMSAALPVRVAVQILQELQQLPEGAPSAALDRISQVVSSAVEAAGQTLPHEQGYTAANALRRELGLPDPTPFPLRRWLRDHSVFYRETTFVTAQVDALACWGTRKAPAVLINTLGTHTRTPGGRHASLAHEVGHLLLDRDGALPAAEVLGGRVARHVEQRAGAFAAELLVPRDVAGRLMARTSEQSAREILREGARSMGTSMQLFALQALNSGYTLAIGVQAVVEGLAGAEQTG